MVAYIEDLNPSTDRLSVAVKVLRLWIPEIIIMQPTYICLILVDEKGTRIQAKLRSQLYFDQYIDLLQEGRWFLLYKFQVIENQNIYRNCNNSSEILITSQTRITGIPPRCPDNFFHLIDALTVENAAEDERNCCVDLCGTVVRVNLPRKIVFLENEVGFNGLKDVLRFTVIDINNEQIQCIAVGDTCSEFREKWEQYVASPSYASEPVLCLLMFWRISVFEGHRCLMSQIRCSKLLLGNEARPFTTDPALLCFHESSDDEDYNGSEEDESDSNDSV